MQQVDLKQAKKNLSELIERAICGEEVVISKNDRPLVRLIAIEKPKRRRQFGSAKGMIDIADDFDDSPEDFREYM